MPVNNSDLLIAGGDNNQSFIKRQGCYIPDANVKKVARSFLVENRKFRKHVFADGSSTVAPKAYIPSSLVPDNGHRNQGLNTVFRPRPDNETNTSGFILNANHINTAGGVS